MSAIDRRLCLSILQLAFCAHMFSGVHMLNDAEEDEYGTPPTSSHRFNH